MKTHTLVLLTSLTCCGLLGAWASRSNSQTPIQMPSRGVASQSLNASLALLKADEINAPEFALTIRNGGQQNVIVKLGYVVPNPGMPGRLPSNLQLTLVDARGTKLKLEPATGPQAGVAGRLENYHVTLRPGATHTIELRLSQFLLPGARQSRLMLNTGEYQIQAQLQGYAAKLRDGDKIPNTSWKVALATNTLKVKLQPNVVSTR